MGETDGWRSLEKRTESSPEFLSDTEGCLEEWSWESDWRKEEDLVEAFEDFDTVIFLEVAHECSLEGGGREGEERQEGEARLTRRTALPIP